MAAMLVRVVVGIVLLQSSAWSYEFPDYLPDDMRELASSVHEACTEKTGLTDDEIRSYHISDNSPKMMCYMKCLLLESSWGRADETINYEFIKGSVHPDIIDIVMHMVDKCKDIPRVSNQDCVNSYNFNVCAQQADPEHWFLV